MTKAVLGIIGGSGIYDLPGLEKVRSKKIKSRGASRRRRCVSVRSRGCRSCFCRATTRATACRPPISTTAPISTCSSAPASPISCRCRPAARSRRNCSPGTFVLIDQFVDRTHKRESSFFGKGCVAHVSMAHPVSPRLRIHLAEAAMAEGINVVRDGTYVCMEGPQFSSYAESMTYKHLGYSVIGMTNMPEAKLAREAEICYATVAMVTDLRLLASRPRCRHRAGHHQGADGERRQGQAPGGAVGQGLPAPARAVPDRLRPRARHRADHRARSARQTELLKKLDAVAGGC